MLPLKPVPVRLGARLVSDSAFANPASACLVQVPDGLLRLSAPPRCRRLCHTRGLRQVPERLCKGLKIDGLVECNSTVRLVRRGTHGVGHVLDVQRANGEKFSWECDAVAVCSGNHENPHVPAIPGIEHVPSVMHSSMFKTRAQFGKDTHVVVCGAGETGMDIAHLAVTAPTASVTLCHRDGFFCAPKVCLRSIGPLKPRVALTRMGVLLDHPDAVASRPEAAEPAQQTGRHVSGEPVRHRVRPPGPPEESAPLARVRSVDKEDACTHLRHGGGPRPVGGPDQQRAPQRRLQ